MFAEFAFVITLAMPVFDATQQVTVRSSAAEVEVAREACWKGRRAAQTMLRDMTVKAHVSECTDVSPPPEEAK